MKKTTIVLELTQQEADTLVLLGRSGADSLAPLHAIASAIEQADPSSSLRQYDAWAMNGRPLARLGEFNAAVEALS